MQHVSLRRSNELCQHTISYISLDLSRRGISRYILEYFLVFLRKTCSGYSLEGASNEYPQHIDFFQKYYYQVVSNQYSRSILYSATRQWQGIMVSRCCPCVCPSARPSLRQSIVRLPVIRQSVCCMSVCPYSRILTTTWVNIIGFSPNLVCALILWRSGLGLLTDKFHQFLTELFACDASLFSILDNNLSKSEWILTDLIHALILWRSSLGLLTGKFRQFLTELFAYDTITAGYYRFTFYLFWNSINFRPWSWFLVPSA